MNDQRLLQPAGNAPARLRLPRRPVACAAGIAAVALLGAIGIVGCQQSRVRSVMPIAAPAPAAPRVVMQRGATNRATLEFQRHALNALLVPLLDDAVPSRFDDPSLSFDCDRGHVTVDGKPLDVGAPVPRSAFVVRWQMLHCDPFDNFVDLTGEVELRVEPRRSGYRVQVRPLGLVVASTHGVDLLDEPFEAVMNVAP